MREQGTRVVTQPPDAWQRNKSMFPDLHQLQVNQRETDWDRPTHLELGGHSHSARLDITDLL